ncbi:MAG: biopolymer transporter ExbD [Bradymonadales bacterium]|jgi:biopolymer transport protein ExbD
MVDHNNPAADMRSEQDEMRRRLIAVRKAKRAARRDDDKQALNLNSMMDMMTIILVFLLKSYGEEPVTIPPNTDVPISIADAAPEDMTVISITKEGLFLKSQKVVDIEEGKVRGNFKKGGDAGLIIEPLEVQLRQVVEEQKNMARQMNKEFKGDMTIVADQGTTYRLLVEVMQTAISTEFKRFRFAVVSGKMDQSGRYSKAPPAE